MWVRSLLSQADAKTRSDGAPQGSERDSHRSVFTLSAKRLLRQSLCTFAQN